MIASFLSAIVHAYFNIDRPIIWETATVLAPELARQVGGIIAAEYPRHLQAEITSCASPL